jgi:hypothetical protein
VNTQYLLHRGGGSPSDCLAEAGNARDSIAIQRRNLITNMQGRHIPITGLSPQSRVCLPTGLKLRRKIVAAKLSINVFREQIVLRAVKQKSPCHRHEKLAAVGEGSISTDLVVSAGTLVLR